MVRLHGKGDKWRTCPLWRQTANAAGRAARPSRTTAAGRTRRCSVSATGQPLTRFGIYKIVRRHAGHLDDARTDRTVSPHIFRHTAAVHLLEAGVEVNVIRGWLGHADLTTTNRYAEINTRAKIEALRNTEPTGASEGPPPSPGLEVRRRPAQLAVIALIVMCRGGRTSDRSPPTRQGRGRGAAT